MNRIKILFKIFTLALLLITFSFKQNVYASTPATPVNLKQVIKSPNCYDTVSETNTTVDYITVWNCEVQP